MATKTKDVTDAPVESAARVELVETPTPTRSRRGLRLTAFIAGGIIAAGLLFGGGVLLGVNLPGGGGQPGFSQGQFPGGTMPEGGPQGGGGQPPQQRQSDDN